MHKILWEGSAVRLRYLCILGGLEVNTVKGGFEMKEKCFKKTLKQNFREIGSWLLLPGGIITGAFVGYLVALALHNYIDLIIWPQIILPTVTGYSCYIVISCVAMLIGILITLRMNRNTGDDALSCLLITELMLGGVYFVTWTWANCQGCELHPGFTITYLPRLMAAPMGEFVVFLFIALVIIPIVAAYAECRD